MPKFFALPFMLAAGLALMTTPTQAHKANYAHKAVAVFAPKVMVITMFPPETKPWLDNEKLSRKIAVPGLVQGFPVSCSPDGLCVVTTGMGYANAASSISALIYSRMFDFKHTYFLIDGIAGVDPNDGTLGSVHWARFAIDIGLRHEIDPRQMPADWTSSFVSLGTDKPGVKSPRQAGSEIYQLNETLLQKAFTLSRDTPLIDSDIAKAYRADHYEQPIAAGPPIVSICDTASSDLYWQGTVFAKQVEDWATLQSDGKANYCTTQMEDNATLTALHRGAQAGLLSFDRIALLRSASDFDREGKGQTPLESLLARNDGHRLAFTNGYRVGAALTHAIVGNWKAWSEGVPAN